MQRLFFFVLLCSFNSTMVWAQRVNMTDFSFAFKLGAYNRAANIGETLLLRKSIQNDIKRWFPLSLKLGVAYHRIGNYNRALNHLQAAIDWTKTEKSYPKALEPQLYYEKAALLSDFDYGSSAIVNYKRVVQLLAPKIKTLSDSSQQAIYLNSLISLLALHYEQGNYDLAAVRSEQAFAFRKRIQKVDKAYQAKHLFYASLLAKRNGAQEVAEQYVASATTLLQAASLTKNGLVWSEVYQAFANYQAEQKAWKPALELNFEAIQQLLPDWKAEKNTLPKVEILKQALSLGRMVALLEQRAQLYQAQQITATDEQALDVYQLMDRYVTALRQLYTGEEVRLRWSNRALLFYEQGIALCLKLAKAKADESYKKEAFRFSERSKSVLLLEAFKGTKARKISGVAAEVIAEEERLELAVSDAQQAVDDWRGRSRRSAENQAAWRQTDQNLRTVQRAYEDFLVELKRTHPDYYQLKHDLSVIDIAALQARLGPDQLLLEYFIGQETMYVFQLSKETYQIIERPLPLDLNVRIRAFRKSIYDYFLGAKQHSDSLLAAYGKRYRTLGYDLHQDLIAPFVEGSSAERLTIILAGNLGLLPFEALLTKATTTDNYQEMPYLLHRFAINYCYSATLLHEMQIKEHVPEKIFLGFSPTFDETKILADNYQFNPLKHSQEEVQEVFDLVGKMGAVFDAEQATKENFQQNCEDYCIIHIATHGVMNTQNAEQSFLAFSTNQDSAQTPLLYVRDLYNMHLTASLVVLSACETGIGTVYKSEGIASLARGFAYAGAKSLITSLWSVNDQATAKIMRYLYQYLKAGMPKDLALQKAKLEFLKTSNPLTAHPFLWSAFVQIGDETPLPQEAPKDDGFWYFFSMVILLLMIGGFGFFFRKYKTV